MRNAHGQPQRGFSFILLILFSFLAGCSGEGTPSGTTPVPAPGPTSGVISTLTEVSSSTQFIPAASGGHVSNEAVTVTFPAAILPANASIKVAKVTVSNSEQDPSLIDMTGAYVISAPSATKELELADSANIVFKVDPAGFDEASIRLVVWDGYEWEEVPTTYDATLKAVTATVEALLPSGTRIYLANPEANATAGRDGGEQIVSEFVAMKVVGESAGGTQKQTAAQAKAAVTNDTIKPGRTVFITSPDGRFKVSYTQPQDSAEALALKAQADAVAGYMDNAYKTIVAGMGLKQPAKTTKANYGKTWPVDLEVISGAYGVADPGTNSISIAAGTSPGDGLSHTCHHEFTHLVQFQTLKDANNSVEDSLDWFGETMADAIGYYAQKGLGTIYALAGESMGYFNVRLDADKHTLGRENDDYEYRHFPFISYLLATYGDAKFKKFFETWYSYTPGSTQISMTTIDTAAAAGLGKAITGRDGIFWDFYRDYFIIGNVFNRDKFKNLAGREKGKPYEVTDEEKEKQGVTLVDVSAGVSFRKEFTVQRLAGQVVILRYKGDSPLGLTVTVTSLPGLSSGRIQLVPVKRVGGVLQSAGYAVEVSDSGTTTINYGGVGTDVHDIYLVMANTAWKADDYKVTVVVAEKS
jgi:hypothetical protein